MHSTASASLFACKLGIGVCAIRLKPLAFARYMDVFSFEIARDNMINSCINEIKCVQICYCK